MKRTYKGVKGVVGRQRCSSSLLSARAVSWIENVAAKERDDPFHSSRERRVVRSRAIRSIQRIQQYIYSRRVLPLHSVCKGLRQLLNAWSSLLLHTRVCDEEREEKALGVFSSCSIGCNIVGRRGTSFESNQSKQLPSPSKVYVCPSSRCCWHVHQASIQLPSSSREWRDKSMRHFKQFKVLLYFIFPSRLYIE